MPEGGLFGGGLDGTGNPTGNAHTLDRIAADLRLTRMQRAFAEALATDTNRNQTRAARHYGRPYGGYDRLTATRGPRRRNARLQSSYRTSSALARGFTTPEITAGTP